MSPRQSWNRSFFVEYFNTNWFHVILGTSWEATETLVSIENKEEAAEVMNLVKNLCQEERENLLVFLEGVRFGKKLAQKIA